MPNFAFTEFYEVRRQKNCPPGICIALASLLECSAFDAMRAGEDSLALHPPQRRGKQNAQADIGSVDDDEIAECSWHGVCR